MEYCIAHKRDLTQIEFELISFILVDSDNNGYLDQLKSLKVIAKCGCDCCPTVLFGCSFDSQAVKNGNTLVMYHGLNNDGEHVSVAIMVFNGQLAELEASSLSGGDIFSWPPIGNLELMTT